jgi:phytanoyl-CoA hydroxylase
MPVTLSIRDQIDRLREDGFVVVSNLVSAERCDAIRRAAQAQLGEAAPPLEYEADLQYPGAPSSQDAPGGKTVRRLVDAYARDALFRDWATAPEIRSWMESYFGEAAFLSRAHHNCIMTKHPMYGSLTGWHRDVRYWSFAREDLVSVWLAVGAETVSNGALWLVPRSHAMDFPADRFDHAKFFRADLPENADLLRTAVSPELSPGDVVFFHAKTLHSAGQNLGKQVKFSLVYTYHGASNPPVPESRSASKPEIAL